VYKLGVMGIDTASSAQSKRVGVGIEHGGTELEGGSMARSRPYWEWLGCAGSDGGIDGEQGVLTGVDGVINDVARV
jgi:hypothetical protein